MMTSLQDQDGTLTFVLHVNDVDLMQPYDMRIRAC